MDTHEQQRRQVVGAGIAVGGAFLVWGVLPVYWKLLAGIQPLEIIAHRVVWSLVFLCIVMRLRGRLGLWRAALVDGRQLVRHGLSAALLGVNWLTFIYAMQTDRVIESSLGYFLVPMCNVALGFVILGERLRALQWVAVALAAVGVGVQLVRVGELPWLALVLAGTWAVYGLLSKKGPLGPVTGLGVETALLAPVAAGYLVWRGWTGEGALGQVGWGQGILLLACGVVTAVPLVWFSSGARLLSMATIGLFQYLAPSVQLVLGVLLYREPFGGSQVWAFGFIWAGLALYSLDAFRAGRRMAKAVVAT